MDDFSEKLEVLTPKKRELVALLAARDRLGKRLSPIHPCNRTLPVPLSFPQQRLWFLDQLDPGSAVYNVPTGVHLSGHLDVASLEATLMVIIARHESLRTTFAVNEGKPVQIVVAPSDAAFSVQQEDLGTLPERERQAEVKRYAREEAGRPFNLSRGPLLRATLLRLADTEHVLLLTLHHIISDGWSLGVLVHEIALLYPALHANAPLPLPLPPLPIQYADFAHWQRQWLQGEVLEKQLSYWRKQLAGELPTLALPFDRPRPPVQTFNGAKETFRLVDRHSAMLQTLSQQKGVTLFMLLLSAFKVLLYRYTGQPDVLVGTPIANRNRVELEGLIGFFVNTLVLRSDLAGNPAFDDLLAQIKHKTLQAYTHQDLPFEQLVEALQPKRDLSYSPLFQVMFVLQESLEVPALPGLELSRLEPETQTAKFDLTLFVWKEGNGLSGAVEYNTDLFDRATIQRLIGHWQCLLEGIVHNPAARLHALPLLTPPERQQLLSEWNTTDVDHPQDRAITALFEAQVAQTPQAVAAIFEDRSLTYADLNARANQLARYLRARGVGPEVLVGLCVERSFDMLIGVLGILKAGGAYVPLDPAYPRERLAFMLSDTHAPILLTQSSLLTQLPSCNAQVVCLDRDWTDIAHHGGENLPIHTQPHNLAYIIYTSGSTGRPKGIGLLHQTLVNLIRWHTDSTHWPHTRTSLLFAPLSFDVSIQEIFTTLVAGDRLCVIDDSVRTDSDQLVRILAEHRVERIFLPFVALQQLCESLRRHATGPALHLKEVITAGEQLSATPTIIGLFASLPGCRLRNQYGPSESHVVMEYALPTETTLWSPLPPIGRPIANTRIYILDAYGEPVPVGVPGELHIGGLGLARGYLNRPGLTAEKFVPNPFAGSGERMYRTGDLARYRPDGNIEFLGRIDHQVKIRGFRIELGEIEAQLCRHPAIREAVVMADGEDGNKRLLAYVVTSDPAPNWEALHMYIKVYLPEYMVPSTFVFLDALPLTPNGKVDRKALPAPDSHRPDLKTPYVPARTPIEATLVRLWSEVLGVERIGVEDDFFILGGHSLKLLELATRIESDVGHRLPITSLFLHTTVSAQARLLGPQHTSASRQSAIVPLRIQGTGPSLLWLHPIGGSALCYRPLANALDINHPLYAMQSPWFGNGRECPTTLRQIAAIYLDHIEEVFGDEPFILGGWSFGALLALEVAQHLALRGRTPLHLLLIDPTHPSAGGGDTALGEIATARTVLTDLYYSQPAAISHDLAARTLSQINTLDETFALGKHHGLLPAALSALEFRGLVELYRRHITAVNHYTPTPYPGASSLYLAAPQSAAACEPDRSYWQKLLTGALAIQAIPATHYSLLQPPAVDLLAAYIQRDLDSDRGAECGDEARRTTGKLAGEQTSSLITLTHGDNT